MKMKTYQPEGYRMAFAENRRMLSSFHLLKEAMLCRATLEARAVLCDSAHNLHVDLGCMRGLIARNEGAVGIEEGTVRDIALISRVNKPVAFRVIGFRKSERGETYAVLSRRAVQKACQEEYISKLTPGDVIDACVTHIENFGVFCDIGAGLSALLPIDGICVSRIPHPSARFAPGQRIKAVVKCMDQAGRITLSHKELLGTWLENADKLHIGDTVPGIVRSVEHYGIFVELFPNLAGLAEFAPNIQPGSHASVYIKNILPERMKIKLTIVDAFQAEYPLGNTAYFLQSGHIDRWVYSPPGCPKCIQSVFET